VKFSRCKKDEEVQEKSVSSAVKKDFIYDSITADTSDSIEMLHIVTA
jgi:hypothetical protein